MKAMYVVFGNRDVPHEVIEKMKEAFDANVTRVKYVKINDDLDVYFFRRTFLQFIKDTVKRKKK